MGVNFAPTPAARGRHWKEVEKVVLVGVSTREQDPATTAQHLAELARLADSAGAVVAGEIVQHRQTFDPATLLGGGKVKELAELCEARGVHKIIFDDDLSPGQAKRLEELTGCMILEVKFNETLPPYVQHLLTLGAAERTAASKYVFCRQYEF